MIESLQQTIEDYWQNKDNSSIDEIAIKNAVEQSLDLLDQGKIRVAEKKDSNWIVNQWVKKAILLSFRFNKMSLISNSPASQGKDAYWYDKVSPKFMNWKEEEFKQSGIRAVPGCFVRYSAYVAKNVILMPSFVNVGSYVDEGTMIDGWATVGSCAQIGKNCHISGGAGIGGVLEPLQANPVIIEDNCFIGARSEVAEGVIIEQGSVLSMGVYIGASTKVVDRETGNISYGRIPAYSVVVPGCLPGKTANSPMLYAVIIVKKVDEKTRSKTSVNELLRDF